MQVTTAAIPDAVRAYLAAGLCALPASKAAKQPVVGLWKPYQRRMPNEIELSAWLANGPDAVCIICGKISGNAEMIDFDFGGELFGPWCDRVNAEAPGLLDRLAIETTQSVGWHTAYRYASEVCGSKVLARRRRDVTEDEITLNSEGERVVVLKGKDYVVHTDRQGVTFIIITLIETRGERGLFLCDPTPGYELLQGDLTNLPVISQAERNVLWQCARDLNEMADKAPTSADSAHNGDSLAHPSHNGPMSADSGHRPGDDYNRRGDVRALLASHGWTYVHNDDINEHWRRPGKNKGGSANLRIEDRTFFVFSSNAYPFEMQGSYSPFAVYAMLEHDGDFSMATRALSQLGFGQCDSATDGVDISALARMSAEITDCATHNADIAHCATDNADNGDSRADDSDNAPSRAGVADPGPFPEDLFDVPGFVGDVVRHTLSVAHRYQPVLALAGAIMLQAVLAARKVRDERGNRTNLYAIGVALSSAGKDKPREVNDRILELADVDLLGNEEVTSDAAVLTAVEARPAILFQFDEFGRFLRTMGDPRKSPNIYSAVTTLMRLYSNANRTYRGKGYADAKRNKTIIQPCACIYGTSTPRAMYESLTKEGVEDGFVGRLIFFETMTRPPRLRRPEADPPEHLVETARWWNSHTPRGGNIETVYPKQRLVEATDEANAVFDALAELSDTEMQRDETYAPVWGRAEEKACRLALVYACSADKDDPVIDADAAQWACRLAEYTTRRTVFTADQWIAEGLFDARQKKVLRVIRNAQVISRSKLCHQTQSLTPKERAEVLENLIQTGLIRAVQVETRGRQRTDYEAV